MQTEHNKAEPNPTPANYKIQVDGTVYSLTNPQPTAREILEFIAKDPSTHILKVIVTGEEERTLMLDDYIDLRQAGIERFTTGPKDDGKKDFTIIVNGEEKVIADKELSYEALVNLAYDNKPPTGPNIIFTITYKRGLGNKPEGSLLAGDTVKIKEGMIFNVTPTKKS